MNVFKFVLIKLNTQMNRQVNLFDLPYSFAQKNVI